VNPVWIIDETDADTRLMAETLGVPEFLAKALANRGVRSKHAAKKFFNPKLERLADFSSAAGAREGAEITASVIKRGGLIAVYGDYDVDGVMSAAILVKALNAMGAETVFMIPNRERDGYGLNLSRAEELYGGGVSLVITVDNGITAVREIEWLKARGVAVVVIDHHEPLETGIPAADAVIDPKRADCPYPFKFMCAAGLAYRFAGLLDGRFAEDGELVSLAAIATFCDVVELTGENRAIARAGLDAINRRAFNNPGLAALMDVRNIARREITAFDIGFIIGPCVNAAGRMDDASLALRLFLAGSEEEGRPLAERLAALNEARKAETERGVEAAIEIAGNMTESVLIIHSPRVKESVAGIIAGRLREKLGKPVIIMTGGGILKGSGRSVEGYDLFRALYGVKDLFERFGGHPMAAGLTIKEERLAEFSRRINVGQRLTEYDLTPKIHADAVIPFSEVNERNARVIAAMEPFGKANHPPVFICRGVRVERAGLVGAGKTTLSLTLSDGARFVKAIFFGGGEHAAAATGLIDAAFAMEINSYNGESSVQMRLLGIGKYTG
jgi:single-stranded-DNA-specific exonuclease